MHTPANYSCTAGSFIIVDLVKAPFFTAKRTEDEVKTTVGLKGESVDTESLDRSGTIELTVRSSSPSNRDLMSLLDSREQFLFVFHDYGNGEHIEGLTRVAGPPEVTVGPEVTERKYKLTGGKIKFTGGAGYSA